MGYRLFWLPLLVFLFNCSDTVGLHTTCRQPVPCGLSQGGNIVVDSNYKAFAQYEVGECKLGTLRCDSDGTEFCEGFIAPVEEICDFKDNDCDGNIDETFDRDFDGFTSCGGDCNDNHGYINPTAVEVCNNIDDNCNGEVDEKVIKSCWQGNNRTVIDSPPSICQSGTSSCTAGLWNPCVNEVTPNAEVCDGLDNDCDGDTDERVRHACGVTDVGACTLGDKVCVGDEQLCVDAVYPAGEICDAADNDCDGMIDEEIYQPCSTACGSGVEICNAGQWIDCDAQQPNAELCNGVDDDCDGDVDEGCPCIDGQLILCRSNITDRATMQIVNCGIGVTMCDEHGVWGPCYFFGIEPETCNNWDDDCDGTVDGMTEVCGDASTAGTGECRLGEKTCIGGIWGLCRGDVNPQTEICDQLDNDCDGLVDENLNPHVKVDMIFAIDISGSMCTSINALVQGIQNYITDFVGTDHRFGIVTFPGIAGSVQVPGIVRTNPPLLEASSFQTTLGQITCNGGGWEPSYDVAYMLSDPMDPFAIRWRSDAYPYIIIISDENAQTWTALAQADIAPQMINCMIGECISGDSIEIYIIGPSYAAGQWDQIIYNDPMRFIDIRPVDPARYTTFFRNVFQNICI